jgi:Protein of unknown function (DUF3616)
MKTILFLIVALSTPMAHAFIPEASGVCRMGETLIISGDEESDTLFVRDQGIIQTVKVNNGKWDDLEGLATVNDKLFFGTTSHGRTKKGKRKPEREQLMLFSKSGNKISVIESWSLRDLILDKLEETFGHVLDMKTVESASFNFGGLNIEGAAYKSGKLYLGLRSPVTNKGEALIVVINNAGSMLNGKMPEIEEIMAVDLNHKGIRSLDVTGSKLLILSGSTDDTDKAFGLTSMNLGTGSLQQHNIKGFNKLMRPEGVVVESDGSMTFVQDFEVPQVQDIIINLANTFIPIL